MKRFLNLKFLLALVLGAGAVAFLSTLSMDIDPDDADHPYGEPDGAVSEGDVSSFVD
jgi:hypothetical protein